MQDERDIPNLNYLNSNTKPYVTHLYKEGWITRNDVTHYVSSILTPEQNPARIAKLHDTLLGLTPPEDNIKHPNVKKGLYIARKFVEKRASTLKKHNMSALIYGSMQHDDPNKGDFDILLVTQKHDDLISIDLLEEWHDTLLVHWGLLNNHLGGEINQVAVEDLQALASKVENDNSILTYAADIEKVHYTMGDAATLLIGKPIYTPDTGLSNPSTSPLLESLRNNVNEIIAKHPILSSAVVVILEKFLAIRKQRATS
jgi:hypothetical protein